VQLFQSIGVGKVDSVLTTRTDSFHRFQPEESVLLCR
jgi:hypothetical protein